MKTVIAPVALAALVAFAAPASAAIVNSFGAPNVPWTVGSGQPGGDFALSTDSESGVQVGLRSQDRFVGVSANDGVSNYFVAAGGPGGGLATWNIDFLIDGAGEALRNFNVALTIDWDPGAGVDEVTYDIDAQLAAAGSSTPIVQQSQNLGFAFWGHAFDPNATGTYVFTLSVNSKEAGGATLARSSINVNVAANAVPEPASLALVGVALLGAAAVRRRRD